MDPTYNHYANSQLELNRRLEALNMMRQQMMAGTTAYNRMLGTSSSEMIMARAQAQVLASRGFITGNSGLARQTIVGSLAELAGNSIRNATGLNIFAGAFKSDAYRPDQLQQIVHSSTVPQITTVVGDIFKRQGWMPESVRRLFGFNASGTQGIGGKIFQDQLATVRGNAPEDSLYDSRGVNFKRARNTYQAMLDTLREDEYGSRMSDDQVKAMALRVGKNLTTGQVDKVGKGDSSAVKEITRTMLDISRTLKMSLDKQQDMLDVYRPQGVFVKELKMVSDSISKNLSKVTTGVNDQALAAYTVESGLSGARLGGFFGDEADRYTTSTRAYAELDSTGKLIRGIQQALGGGEINSQAAVLNALAQQGAANFRRSNMGTLGVIPGFGKGNADIYSLGGAISKAYAKNPLAGIKAKYDPNTQDELQKQALELADQQTKRITKMLGGDYDEATIEGLNIELFGRFTNQSDLDPKVLRTLWQTEKKKREQRQRDLDELERMRRRDPQTLRDYRNSNLRDRNRQNRMASPVPLGKDEISTFGPGNLLQPDEATAGFLNGILDPSTMMSPDDQQAWQDFSSIMQKGTTGNPNNTKPWQDVSDRINAQKFMHDRKMKSVVVGLEKVVPVRIVQ